MSKIYVGGIFFGGSPSTDDDTNRGLPLNSNRRNENILERIPAVVRV